MRLFVTLSGTLANAGKYIVDVPVSCGTVLDLLEYLCARFGLRICTQHVRHDARNTQLPQKSHSPRTTSSLLCSSSLSPLCVKVYMRCLYEVLPGESIRVLSDRDSVVYVLLLLFY